MRLVLLRERKRRASREFISFATRILGPLNRDRLEHRRRFEQEKVTTEEGLSFD
jgi:hypothetical protein